MSIQYVKNTGEQIQGFCKNCYSATLQANDEKTLTVPGMSTMGISSTDSPDIIVEFNFPYNANIWVAVNATATTASSAFAATQSELNPFRKLVKRGDVLHFKTADTSDIIGVKFYPVI